LRFIQQHRNTPKQTEQDSKALLFITRIDSSVLLKMSVSSPQPTTFTTLTIPTAMMADATAPNLTTPFANMPTPIVIVDAAGELHDPKIVTVGGITGVRKILFLPLDIFTLF
jgi:hypothetical protein